MEEAHYGIWALKEGWAFDRRMIEIHCGGRGKGEPRTEGSANVVCAGAGVGQERANEESVRLSVWLECQALG